jgi:DNA gyrase/topoisomerase IV subunit B
MNELITRGHVFIAQPRSTASEGKSEKYIKDEKEFTKEMRRATGNLTLEIQSTVRLAPDPRPD